MYLILFKLGAVGEGVVLLLVLPTKWKLSGLLSDWSKPVNPPGGYILKIPLNTFIITETERK
jgi:hypothetical protein